MKRSLAAASTLDRIEGFDSARLEAVNAPALTRRTRPSPPDRVDLVVLGGRWVAIHTGPHALAVMETSPDRSCMLPTPFKAKLPAADVMDWQRSRVPPGTIITAEPSPETQRG